MARTFLVLFLFVFSFFVVLQSSKYFPKLVAESNKSDLSENTSIENSFKKLTSKEKFDVKSGDITIINFWASWCSPCMRELPSLNRLYSLYKDKGVRVLAVNSDYEDQEKIIKETKRKMNLDFKFLIDKKGTYVSAFNVEGLPVTILMKGSKYIEKVNGEIDFDSTSFQKKIDQLLQVDMKN